jgi:hypothetical protein
LKKFPVETELWTPHNALQNQVLIVIPILKNFEKLVLSMRKRNMQTLIFTSFIKMFQNLKNVNYGIILLNCVAHTIHNTAKKAAYKMIVDHKIFTVKIASSAKHTAASNSVFALVDNARGMQLCHISTQLLRLHPAIVRLDKTGQLLNRILLVWVKTTARDFSECTRRTVSTATNKATIREFPHLISHCFPVCCCVTVSNYNSRRSHHYINVAIYFT